MEETRGRASSFSIFRIGVNLPLLLMFYVDVSLNTSTSLNWLLVCYFFPPSFAICFLGLFCPARLPYDSNLFPRFHNFWSRLRAFCQQLLAAGHSSGHGSHLLPAQPAAHSEMRPGEIQPSSAREFLRVSQAVPRVLGSMEVSWPP